MRQGGVALLGVLLVVSIVTVLAVGMAHSNMVRLGLTERRLESAQAWQIWQAGVEWSRDILREDLLRSSYDAPGEFWGRGIKDYSAEGARLSGVIVDQQGLFNLNNLVQGGQASTADVGIYRRLLARLGMDPALAYTLVDWLDPDPAARPGGAEDAAYAAMQPAYRAADRAMADLAELYWVKGYDAAIVERLRPYVSVLPEATPVNVNSASKPVLGALLPDLDESQVAALWARLQARPCADMGCFRQLLPSGVAVSDSEMNVASRYFLLQLVVTDGGSRAEGSALLSRTTSMPSVVWRSRGLVRPPDLSHPLSQADLTGGI